MDIKGVYRHYKGKYYEVLSPAADAESGAPYVFYRQMYEPYGYWIRPWDMFFGTQEVDGQTVRRFVRTEDGPAPSGRPVPPEVSVVHSETLERYTLAGQDGEKVLVRATGERADDLARR